MKGLPATLFGKLTLGILGTSLAPTLAAAQFEDQPPARYEIVIDGENFTVEENRVTTVRSQKNPDRTYQVAVRVAPLQPWRLNNIEFLYNQGFAVRDDRAAELRRAELRHNLGFTVAITDLGGTIDAEDREKAVQLLIEATVIELQRDGGADIEPGKITTRKFGPVTGTGAALDYQQDGVPYRALAYLMTTAETATSVLIDYPAAKQEAALAIVKPTLESFQSADRQ